MYACMQVWTNVCKNGSMEACMPVRLNVCMFAFTHACMQDKCRSHILEAVLLQHCYRRVIRKKRQYEISEWQCSCSTSDDTLAVSPLDTSALAVLAPTLRSWATNTLAVLVAPKVLTAYAAKRHPLSNSLGALFCLLGGVDTKKDQSSKMLCLFSVILIIVFR